SCGMTTVRSCRMIDAVTYGMIPSAKIEKRESAEPENRFSSPSSEPPLPLKKFSICAASTPGAGSHEPNRYAERTAAVNRSRRRRPGPRHALASQENNGLLLAFRGLGRFGGLGGGLHAALGAALQVLRLALLALPEERQGAAGLLDLVLRRLRGAVH